MPRKRSLSNECELARVKAALGDAKAVKGFRRNSFLGIGIKPVLERPPKDVEGVFDRGSNLVREPSFGNRVPFSHGVFGCINLGSGIDLRGFLPVDPGLESFTA